MRDPKIPTGVVSALGLTQIIGYGTLYYSFSILAPSMGADLGLGQAWVFCIFSASLFVGGLCATFIGRHMDRIGAAAVMAIGSAFAAAMLALCAWAPTPALFALAIVLLEIASGMVQYQAAFAALVESEPRTAARSITYLTLIGGFASTIFWPVAAALTAYLSWREIYVVFAGLNLFVCLPLHIWIMRRGRIAWKRPNARVREVVIGTLAPEARQKGMVLVSAAFALQGFALAAVLAHMVPMLTALGLGTAAVAIGALFGPAQVLSRLINMLFGTRLSPLSLAILSGVLIVVGVAIPVVFGGSLPGAVAFAVCLGLGSGINSIAQGSLPLALFGSDGYGTITGKMAAARLAVGSAAPFVFAGAMEHLGIGGALFANALFGIGGVLLFVTVAASTARPITATS